jgi:hypothetical protein
LTTVMSPHRRWGSATPNGRGCGCQKKASAKRLIWHQALLRIQLNEMQERWLT